MASGSIQLQTGQIWFLEHPRLGKAEDGHYVLVTQLLPSKQVANINFIATDSSSHDDFKIDKTTDGFGTTGLKHTCHLLRDRSYDIEFSLLRKGSHRGFVSGELKKEIEEWWGEQF